MGSSDWRASSAYLYLLHLEPAALAWEYLRRNSDYREAWQALALSDLSEACRWGLEAFIDPSRDARDVHPSWLEVAGSTIRIAPSTDPRDQSCFSVWTFPGRKTIHFGASDARLRMEIDPATHLELAISDGVPHGSPFLFAVDPGGDRAVILSALARALKITGRRLPWTPGAACARPRPQKAQHRLMLQALDGDAAGVSHREIAEALFGEQQAFERWGMNSELRAQLRHLIRRARHLMHGGYRALLSR